MFLLPKNRYAFVAKQFLIKSVILQYMALGSTSVTFLLMKKKCSKKKITKRKY